MTPILLVGEARGKDEAQFNSSFIGPSGAELIRMLGESGIIRLSWADRDYLHRYYSKSDPAQIEAIWNLHPEVHRTNVFQIHPPGNDLLYFCGGKAVALPGYPALMKSKFVRAEFEHELDRLANEIMAHNPNLIICLGNTSLWALAGRTGITKLRGTTLLSTHTAVDFKLLPTYHPSAILRQWDNRPTVIADLMKARRESAYPEIRRPPREIWIEPSVDDIRTFIRDHIRPGDLLSVDIETAGQRITCIGFGPSASLAIVIPFDDDRRTSGCYWPTRQDERACWNLVREVLEDGRIRKLFQNGQFDCSFLLRAYGIKVMGFEEDTMLLSHALQPESLKGLGYLGSIYSDEGSWKGMRKKTETIKKDN